MDDPDKIIKDLHIEAAQLLAQKYSDEAIVSALNVNSVYVDPAFWGVDPPAKQAIRVRA